MRDHQTFNPLGDFFRHLTPVAGAAGLTSPWAAYEYTLDAWQRSVLLLDVLRQQANRAVSRQMDAAMVPGSDEDALLGQDTARLLAALRRLSEVNAEHYEQYFLPWLEKILTPALAHLLAERHLWRLDEAVLSDQNPLMQGVQQLAATVRADRHPADRDNPYLLLQQQLSGLLADALHACADLRDQSVEQIFLTLRVLPEWPQPSEAARQHAQPVVPAKTAAKSAVSTPVVAKAAAPRETTPGKPAVARKPAVTSKPATVSKPVVTPDPAKSVAAMTGGNTPAVAAQVRPADARADKRSGPRPVTSKQAPLPGVTEQLPADTIPPVASLANAQPAVVATPAGVSKPEAAPVVSVPAEPVAPEGKAAVATPSAAMAATIAALVVPAEKTAPARAPITARRKTSSARSAAAKSAAAGPGTAGKPVPPTTPRKR